MTDKVRIGTRGSKLALVQAHMVEAALREHHPEIEPEIVIINSSAEWKPEQGETRLSEADGGKGLFAKEIEEAIFDGHVDCGVHSMKDMASFLPDGLIIEHMLSREDAREAYLDNNSGTIDKLPEGATVGTSSMRRQSILLSQRPDLKVVPFRGNVPTRIEKLRAGQVDATILAYAGIKRLGLEGEISAVLEAEDFMPAAGQGAVGIEIKEDNDRMRGLLSCMNCETTRICVDAERTVLQVLDGSCHTPIGASASLKDGVITLKAFVASPDGAQKYYEEVREAANDHGAAVSIGKALGEKLARQLPPGFLD